MHRKIDRNRTGTCTDKSTDQATSTPTTFHRHIPKHRKGAESDAKTATEQTNITDKVTGTMTTDLTAASTTNLVFPRRLIQATARATLNSLTSMKLTLRPQVRSPHELYALTSLFTIPRNFHGARANHVKEWAHGMTHLSSYLRRCRLPLNHPSHIQDPNESTPPPLLRTMHSMNPNSTLSHQRSINSRHLGQLHPSDTSPSAVTASNLRR